MVGFHHNETTPRRQAYKFPLPGEDNSPLCSGLPDKVQTRNPPLITGIVTENAKPLRECSQIAIGCESDIHISLGAGKIAV
jgi:hypothetical protein